MIYTLIGTIDYLNIEINKIIKDISKENIAIFDLIDKEININNIIVDLDTFSLFGKRAVVINNIEALDDTSSIIKYINNPSDNILIITSTKELDKRKNISKILKDKTKVINLLNYDLTSFVKENLEDYTMSFKDINLLVSYCDNNIMRIKQELEKLKLYKMTDKTILGEDIKKLVRKSYDSTIFNLIDNINQKNKEKLHKVHNELLFLGDTDDKIIYTIANHYRLLYQISIKSKTKTDKELLEEYKMHPYRLTKLKQQLSMISEIEILAILKKLSDIDIKYKMGNTDLNTEIFTFFEKL